jgi:hypothetical protein
MLKRVLAIVAADDVKTGCAEALIEELRDSLADPVQVRLSGAVVEGEHEQKLMMHLRGQLGGFRCGLIGRVGGREKAAEQHKGKKQKRRAQWMKSVFTNTTSSQQ